MEDIFVECVQDDKGWMCSVKVRGQDDVTNHEVHVHKRDYKKLAKDMESVERLVRRSFEFLLKRETKDSILGEFDLMDIKKYFPEFEKEIK